MLGSDIVLVIVGNKIDLQKDRHVSQETAESYAESVGATHYETSAKNNVGVEEVFLGLTQLMIAASDLKRPLENAISRTNSMRRSRTVTVAASDEDDDDTAADEGNQQATSSSRCCGTA